MLPCRLQQILHTAPALCSAAAASSWAANPVTWLELEHGGSARSGGRPTARLFASKGVDPRTPAEQQPNRAAELGAQQAAYEALNAVRLCKVPLTQRDLVWAATQQCGLGDTPQELSAASADAATVSRAAQRNNLLRSQGIPIPWDHVTEWEVTHFWMAERGLEKGSPFLKQLLKFAASKVYGTRHDVPNLRRWTAAFDDAAGRHPRLGLDVNRLLSSDLAFTGRRGTCTVETSAEAFMCKVEAVQEVLAGKSDTFSVYSIARPLLYFSRERFIERVENITKLLHGMDLSWHDMHTGSWFGFLINLKPESLEATIANLVEIFSADDLPRLVKLYPHILSTSAERLGETIQALTTALGVPREAVLALIVQHPGVLRAAPKTLTGAIATLARIPELGPAVALKLCMQYPGVATYNGDSLFEKWQSLHSITAMRPEWRAEFVEWPASIGKLGNVLSRPLDRHQRLRYLATSQDCSEALVASCGAFTWLLRGTPHFDGFCPGYREWLSDQ